MPSALPEFPDAAYVVGDLLVDVGQQRVTRAGSDIPLPNLSFRFLMALVRAAPNVLDNETAMTQVWPGLVVSPETVNKRVNLLREALGDDAREPRYIVGVRSRGYRLIAPVSPHANAVLLSPLPAQAAEAVQAPPDLPDVLLLIEARATESPKPQSPKSRWAALSAVAVGLLVVGAIAIRWTGRHQREVDIPTSTASSATAAAIGPLSRTVAVLPFDSISADHADAYLALGLPEMILNRLSRVSGLSVISRNSSFALPTKNMDSREIGRRLHSGYLIGGSVQREADRLRVAVQLVDTAAGTLVWSAHFDRGLQDIFSIEDEIADQLAGALSVRLGKLDPKPQAGSSRPLAVSSSTNFDAYLQFLQAGALLSTWRLADTRAAVARAAKAVELDPRFAAAYVLLARATIRSAEFDVTADRTQRMAVALPQAQQWLQQALALDPNDSRAYVERAYLTSLHDTVAAEKDYRHALELNPNDADAYAGLAAILADDPARREAAIVAIDQARKLNPLDTRLDVLKATLLFYGRGDADGAADLLMATLTRDPLNVPALARLEELRWATGHQAEAVNLGEQVLSRDPHSAQARQILVLAYLDMDELRAAQSVAAGNEHADVSADIATRLYVRDAQAAANLAYAAAQSNTLSGATEIVASNAIRIAARKSGQFARAATLFTQRGGIQWDASGRLLQGDITELQVNAVGLADMLMQMGDTARARALLESSLAAMDYDVRVNRRGDNWYFLMRPIALTLLGRRDPAISVLQKRAAAGSSGDWYYERDPAFAVLQNDPRIVALHTQSRAHAQAERAALQQMRAEGLVPRRG
jgi:TolB-like protein/DNA-binding winged helix-turn-helix (wHTH) protein/Tfp pilus assembly protein PilF